MGHYEEAVDLVTDLFAPRHSDYGTRDQRIAEAQVHATLALVDALNLFYDRGPQ